MSRRKIVIQDASSDSDNDSELPPLIPNNIIEPVVSSLRQLFFGSHTVTVGLPTTMNINMDLDDTIGGNILY